MNQEPLPYPQMRKHAEQLESENADLKAKLEAQETECGKLGSAFCELKLKLAQAEETADHFKGRANEFADKLAEYDRKIKAGELVPVDVCNQWIGVISQFECCCDLKQFAIKQQEASEEPEEEPCRSGCGLRD